MNKIVTPLSLLEKEIREDFLKVLEDKEDEILIDEFEEKLTKTFPEFDIEKFLEKKGVYESWEVFVTSFLQIFAPSSEKKKKVKNSIKKESSKKTLEYPEGVQEILEDKGLSSKEKIFRLKKLGVTRSKVIEFDFCHWTYVYELWRI